jgi:hypothetical protein
MLQALVLVCSMAAPSCSPATAIDVIAVPAETFASPITCLMHGQAYLAGSSIGRGLRPDERLLVVCRRSGVR